MLDEISKVERVLATTRNGLDENNESEALAFEFEQIQALTGFPGSNNRGKISLQHGLISLSRQSSAAFTPNQQGLAKMTRFQRDVTKIVMQMCDVRRLKLLVEVPLFFLRLDLLVVDSDYKPLVSIEVDGPTHFNQFHDTPGQWGWKSEPMTTTRNFLVEKETGARVYVVPFYRWDTEQERDVVKAELAAILIGASNMIPKT